MSANGASNGLWTAQLEVFEQEFDTAMTIWSLEDPAVARLCVEELPMTRRRKKSTINSQVEFSQLSDSSQLASTQSRRRKRRRVVAGGEASQDRDAPPQPPPSYETHPTQTQDLGVMQKLTLEDGDDISTASHEVLAQGITHEQTLAEVHERRPDQTAADLPIPGARKNVSVAVQLPESSLQTPAPMPLVGDQENSVFSQSRPLACAGSRTTSDAAQAATDDGFVVSGFSTGSGHQVVISRKRLREFEVKSLSDDAAILLSISSGTESSSPITAAAAAKSTSSPNPPLERDYSPFIDPRRRSFSSINDGSGGDAPCGFKTGTGEKIQLSADSLRKYSSLLFDDEGSYPGYTPTDASLHFSDQFHLNPSSRSPPGESWLDLPGNSTTGLAVVAQTVTNFQPGPGGKLTVSKARLSKYEHSIFSDEQRCPEVQDQIRPSRVPTPRQAGGLSSVGRGSTVASGFQTASGRTVAITEERLKEMENRLFGEDEPGATASMDNASGYSALGKADNRAAVIALDESGCSFSVRNQLPAVKTPKIQTGFQTGLGSRINVSQDKLQVYNRQFAEDELEGESAGADSISHVVLAGFTSGNGAQLSLSQDQLRLYESSMNEDDPVATPSWTSSIPSCADKPITSLSGFTTGAGKKVFISKEKLEEYEEKLIGNENHELGKIPTDEESIGGFMADSGSRASVSEEKILERRLSLTDESGSLETKALPSGDRSTGVLLSGFTTGGGGRVSISKEKLREYQVKMSDQALEVLPAPQRPQGSEDKSGDDECDKAKRYRLGADEEFASDVQRPPKFRSIGSASSVDHMVHKSRRHSLPPRPETISTGTPSSASVSRGVIQRMGIANQKQRRPPVLDDVSNIPNPRVRTKSAGTGGKWKAPQQLSVVNSGYSTPAKRRASTHQSMSTKKGFLPPIPSKTPPSKSIATPTRAASPKAVGVHASKLVAAVAMPFREAMRISYKLLATESVSDGASFQCEARVQQLRQITAENATSVKFSESDDDFLGVHKDQPGGLSMAQVFDFMKQQGWIQDEAAVSTVWFRNHFRWVVWKLALMELRSPRFLFGRYLTKSQVMYQMCLRFHRDVALAQRSLLKKILHRDANAASCMVLRIAAVVPYPVQQEKDVDIIPPPHWKLAIVLTDGWHAVYGTPDINLAEAMWKQHQAGRLIGMKLVTWSATLQNVSDGADPLECAISGSEPWTNPLWAGKDEPSKWPYLKLQYNSTRPVSVDTRLGLESLVHTSSKDAPYDFVLLKSVPMRSLEVGGGIVRSVSVKVTRISPVLHLQSKDFTIGPRILCEEHMGPYLQARQEYLQSQKRAVDGGDDSSTDHTQVLPLPVPFVKLEVECAHEAMPSVKCYAVLTVWRPREELMSKVKEGGTYHVTSLSVNWKVHYGTRGVFLRVGTTKGSSIEVAGSVEHSSQVIPTQPRICESIDDLVARYQQHVNEMPKEKKMQVDVCVVVVRSEDSKQPQVRSPEACSSTTTDHVFVTDRSGRLMSLRINSTRIYKPSISDLSEDSVILPKAFERVFGRGSKKVWSEGSVLCIRGLEVSHYDQRLGLLDCELVESAQIVSLPSKKSHFYDDAQSLRDLVSSCSGASDESRAFARKVQALKKYVERSVLLLDFTPNQDDKDEFGYLNEANHGEVDHLTQDLDAQLDSDVSYWMSQAPVMSVEGVVIKLVTLDEGDPRLTVCDAAAIAYVRSTSNNDDDGGVSVVYLSREAMEKTVDSLDVQDGDGRSVSKQEVLRFEAQWETSERLLNSWKPWERDGGATFLMATDVSIADWGGDP